MDEWKYYRNENFQLKSGWGLNVAFAIDGLFDFVRQGDSRFGMVLGIAFEFLDFKNVKTDSKNAWGVTVPLGGKLRIGFKGQFDNSVLDLILGIPYAGGVSISRHIGAHSFVNTTLTLGYKHFF